MTDNLRDITLRTDSTGDKYHTLMETSLRSALDKLFFNLDKQKVFATSHGGVWGVWFQGGYPINTEQPYHLRFLEGHKLQVEPDSSPFDRYICHGHVPLDFSHLQIICKDEAAHQQLLARVEEKGGKTYVPAIDPLGIGLILNSDGTQIPVLSLRQFNQAAMPFVQRRYDAVNARFAPLNHPPEGTSYTKLLVLRGRPEYRDHFDLVDEFNFWKNALEKSSKI